jgi:hypothetical protein
MSLTVFKSNLLSLKPHVYNKDGVLVIETGFLFRLLSLFSYYRRVEMSAQNRTITILRKIFPYFPSTIKLDFDDIYYLDYSFDSIVTDFSTNQWSFGEHTDQAERFSVNVVTKDNQKYLIGSFMGEGSICTGMRGVMISDDSIIDFSGTQEEESLEFVKILSKILQVPIGQPLKDIADMIDCPACGHPNASNLPKCIYCGAVLKPDEVENVIAVNDAKEKFEESLL